MWPLWTGPTILVGAPFIAVALYLPLLSFLPCVFILMARGRSRQRAAPAAVQMEGRRANARYSIAANAEAARVSAERLALEGAARPEEPRQMMMGTRILRFCLLRPTRRETTPSDQCLSGESPSGDVAEPQATETPAYTCRRYNSVIASPVPA